MPKFVVTMKWGGETRRIEAENLRAAQDKAFAIFGPYTVIQVRESREHPDAQGKP